MRGGKAGPMESSCTEVGVPTSSVGTGAVTSSNVVAEKTSEASVNIAEALVVKKGEVDRFGSGEAMTKALELGTSGASTLSLLAHTIVIGDGLGLGKGARLCARRTGSMAFMVATKSAKMLHICAKIKMDLHTSLSVRPTCIVAQQFEKQDQNDNRRPGTPKIPKYCEQFIIYYYKRME